MKAIFSIVFCMLFSVVGLFAHPGHGLSDTDQVEHFLTDPYHVIIGLGVIALGLVLIFGRKRIKAFITPKK